MSRPSGLTLVGSVPLSTAFRPFTPLAPPADMLMGSQPGPSGWQLTEGGVGSVPALLTTCAGMVSPLAAAAATAPAAWFAAAAGFAAAAAGAEADRPAVDGVRNGPVSREHPAVAQPVAAGPAKVGASVPMLVDVMVLVVLATR